MIGQSALAEVLCAALFVYTIILLVRVIVSWAELFGFRRPYSGPLHTALGLLYAVTEPVLGPLRALIPPIRAGGVGLDLSIILAFVILFVLRTAIC